MFLKYFLPFTVVAASFMADLSDAGSALADKTLDEIEPALAKIEEFLSRESTTDISCIEKALCLQAIDTSDPGHNPIKILARLTVGHGSDTIRDKIDPYPHLQLAIEALDIGNEFHTKRICEKAFAKCKVPSAQLEDSEIQVTDNGLPAVNDVGDFRPKRSTGCRRSNCQAYSISCLFLSATIVGSSCLIGLSTACEGCSRTINDPAYWRSFGINFGGK